LTTIIQCDSAEIEEGVNRSKPPPSVVYRIGFPKSPRLSAITPSAQMIYVSLQVARDMGAHFVR